MEVSQRGRGLVEAPPPKSRDDHPGMPSWRWEGRVRGRYFSSPHVLLSAQELASFGGQSIKNAVWDGAVTIVCQWNFWVSEPRRGEMRLPPPFRPIGSARGRNSANASC